MVCRQPFQEPSTKTVTIPIRRSFCEISYVAHPMKLLRNSYLFPGTFYENGYPSPKLLRNGSLSREPSTKTVILPQEENGYPSQEPTKTVNHVLPSTGGREGGRGVIPL